MNNEEPEHIPENSETESFNDDDRDSSPSENI